LLEFVLTQGLSATGALTSRFAIVSGVLVESLGTMWVAHSPISGETSLLNDESAAILEVLREGPDHPASVCAALSQDSGLPAEQLAPLVAAHWPQLLDAGLVRALACADTAPA
jgi:PqqD family protein of HPr-rel-A system